MKWGVVSLLASLHKENDLDPNRHHPVTATRRRKLAMTLAAALAGGSMLSTCETRLRNAVVSGTKDYFFSILNPTTIVDLLFPSETDGSEE